MSERLLLEGRLREKEREAETLRLKIAGLRDSVRMALDRFVPVEKINADVAAAQCVELAALRHELIGTLSMIEALRADLGEK